MLEGLTIRRSPAPVRAEAVRILQSAIAAGTFAPGQRLVERELCEVLGASRTTVREALRQLEAEGLVRVVPGKGVAVASISFNEAVALYQVREALEGLAGRLFAQNASDAAVAQIKALVNDIAATIDETRNDPKRVLAVKDQLYDVLFEGCGNPILRALAESVHARVTLLRSLSLSHPGRMSQMLAEIRTMVEAFERRDQAAAERACVEHVRSAARAALVMRAEAANPPIAKAHVS